MSTASISKEEVKKNYDTASKSSIQEPTNSPPSCLKLQKTPDILITE